MHCPNCDAIEKAEREELERFIRETEAKERIMIAGIKSAIREAEREEKKRTVKCEICGKTFTTYRLTQVCCSAECGNKRFNRISSHRKDARITDDKRVDKDITALSLFDRDGGVCWICGERCDLTDYTVKDGTIICGNKYPSIDHIIPICDGGEDSWDNVRLAHRICNSKRYFAEKIVGKQQGKKHDGERVRPCVL